MTDDSGYEILRQTAAAAGCAELLDSRRPGYLRYAYEVQANKVSSKNDTPAQIAAKLLKCLRKSVNALEAIHVHHTTMDKKYFKELATSDSFMMSYTADKIGGRPIAFARYGMLMQGMWSLTANSPQADALISALFYHLQVATAHILPEAEGQSNQFLLVQDWTGAANLDFNIAVHSRYINLAADFMSPLDGMIVVIGVSRVAKLFLKLLKCVISSDVTENWSMLENKEDLDAYVERSDTPTWIHQSLRSEGEGSDKENESRPFKAGDRWNVWRWERCLSKKSDITMSDMHRTDLWAEEDKFENIRWDDSETGSLALVPPVEISDNEVELPKFEIGLPTSRDSTESRSESFRRRGPSLGSISESSRDGW